MVDRAHNVTRHANDAAATPVPAHWSLWLLAPLLAAAFFAAEHDVRLAGRQVGGVEETTIVDSYLNDAEGGNRLRQVGFLSFAAMGGLMLVAGRARRWSINWPMALLVVATLLWALATAVWSVDATQSLRRLAVVVCCLIGVAGVARFYTARNLCRLVVVSGLSLVVVSLLLDFAAGAGPWLANYRFGGTLHPNITACYCAVVCLAACALAGNSQRGWWWWAVFAVALGLMILTKSRTAVGSLAVALVVFSLARLPALTRWWAVSTLAAVGAAIALLLATADTAVRDRVYDTFLLGRRAEAKSLTGRIPLWQELWEYAEDRPYLGYGYQSFWSPEHINELFKSQQWAISSAHSAYVELTLGIGLVGVSLVTLLAIVGTWLALCRFRATRDLAYGFVFAVLVYGLVNGALESLFVETRFPAVMAVCGLWMVAFFDLHPQEIFPIRREKMSGDFRPLSLPRRMRLPLPDESGWRGISPR